MRRIHRTDLDVRRVELGDGDWAEVRTRQLAGDVAYVQRRMTHTRFDVNSGRPDIEFDMGAGNAALLERMVVKWGGPGFCQHDHDADGSEHGDGSNGCRPVPINREAFEAMDQDTFDSLVRAVNRSGEPDPTPGEPVASAT